MSINYNLLICVLLIGAVILLCHLLKKVNELLKKLNYVETQVFRVYDRISAIYTLTDRRLSDVEKVVEDELHDDDEEDWEPEPEDDEEIDIPEYLKRIDTGIECLTENTFETVTQLMRIGNFLNFGSRCPDEDPIHLITPNEYFFEGDYKKYQLVYREERDELRYYYNDGGYDYIVIANVEECIGDGLKFFGVNSKDQDVVYVRNNNFYADFRITKIAYDEEL